jgi:hypothetical protein
VAHTSNPTNASGAHIWRLYRQMVYSTYLLRIFTIVGLALLCCELYGQQQGAPSSPQSSPTITFTLHDDRPLSPEDAQRQFEQMMDLGVDLVFNEVAEGNIVRDDWKLIRKHLRGEDLSLAERVSVGVVRSEQVNASGNFRTERISFNNGPL